MSVRRSGCVRKVAVVAVACVLTVGTARAQHPVQSVWLTQELLLYYAGHRTLYTCGAIERKVRAVLLDMGARGDLGVRASGCAASFQLESRSANPPGRPPPPVITMPQNTRGDVRVAIVISTPVELTPALIEAVQQRQGEQELLLRATGKKPATGIRSFGAAWQRAPLTHSADALDDSDCELVSELILQIFPRISVRPVANPGRCSASQSSGRGSQALLLADALLPVAGVDGSVTPLSPP